MIYGILAIGLMLAAPSSAGGRGEESLEVLIERELPGLIGIYERLHENPELSYREEKTAAFIAERLVGLGFGERCKHPMHNPGLNGGLPVLVPSRRHTCGHFDNKRRQDDGSN